MNLINQREDLRLCYEAGMIDQLMLRRALEGPVFVVDGEHRKMSEDETEWTAKNVMHTDETSKSFFPRIVPFPNFRLFVPKHQCYCQWWFNMEDCQAICLMRDDDREGASPDWKHPVHARAFIDRFKTDAILRIHYNYKALPFEDYKDEVRMLKNALGYIRSKLGFFLFDVMSSASTVVKVTEDQPGRSVQWRLNREHYLVLNHHQAQTMQKNKRGVTDKDLVRGAHWRRAHLRRLSSDKFKHKKGLIVPVKKAWVGPEEWKGHDGKIYKVTDINKLDS